MTSSSKIVINHRGVTCLLKPVNTSPFINESQKTKATAISHIHFFGFLDSRACHLSFRLINRTEGHSFFSPSCPFSSPSSLRRLSARAQPPSSTFASTPTTAVASTWSDQRNAAPLRHSFNSVSFLLLHLRREWLERKLLQIFWFTIRNNRGNLGETLLFISGNIRDIFMLW